jgi:hypothetical protein
MLAAPPAGYDILTADGFLKDAWFSAATRRSESWDTFTVIRRRR